VKRRSFTRIGSWTNTALRPYQSVIARIPRRTIIGARARMRLMKLLWVRY